MDSTTVCDGAQWNAVALPSFNQVVPAEGEDPRVNIIGQTLDSYLIMDAQSNNWPHLYIFAYSQVALEFLPLIDNSGNLLLHRYTKYKLM